MIEQHGYEQFARAYIIVFTLDFRPAATKHVVRPSGKLPLQLFIHCPEEGEYFDHVERCFRVEVHVLKFFHNKVYERLYSPRVFIIEGELEKQREKD